MATYKTIEVPTERTELDEEIVMYLVKAVMGTKGRDKHLAGIAVMRELARQFPTANITEISAEWEKRILKAQAEQGPQGGDIPWGLHNTIEEGR